MLYILLLILGGNKVELNEMTNKQNNFDSEHGWALKTDDVTEMIKIINNDLIGLFGEIGEFANIVKKINLYADRVGNEELKTYFANNKVHLEEELIDSLIYLMRIASHLKIDLTSAYLQKLAINTEKYKDFEITTPE